MQRANLPTVTVPLRDAVAITQQWWDQHNVLADLDAEALQDDLEDVVASALAEGYADLDSLLLHGHTVITSVTGIARTTAFADLAGSDHIHRVRNSMGAMISACEQSLRSDPRPLELLHALPLVAKRHGGDERPLTDDEIVLTRSDAILCMSRGGRYRIPAVQYALADAGARPYETTQVTPNDFDDPRSPTMVQVHGSGHLAKPRLLPLNAWAQPHLAAALDVHLGIHKDAAFIPLGYGGRSGAYSASASAAGVLTRSMRRAGIGMNSQSPADWHKIKGSEPAATAIPRWRIAKTLDTEGPIAALKIMGRYDPRHLKVGVLHDFINRTTITEVDHVSDERTSFKGL